MGDDVRLLLAVFFGFYLIDCALLLKPTEALVSFGLRWRAPRKLATPSSWRRSIGTVDLSLGYHWLPLRGSIVAWLNPLTPWRLQFRCPPLVRAAAGSSLVRPSLPLHRLLLLQAHNRRLAPLLVLHAFLLFGVLPYFLILDLLAPLLMFLGLAFASALTIVLACLPARQLLRLSHRAYWSLALQAVICLPNSLNFPRKLALLGQTRQTVAHWLPAAAPARQARIAWDLQCVLATFFDDDHADLAAARQVVGKYRAES